MLVCLSLLFWIGIAWCGGLDDDFRSAKCGLSGRTVAQLASDAARFGDDVHAAIGFAWVTDMAPGGSGQTVSLCTGKVTSGPRVVPSLSAWTPPHQLVEAGLNGDYGPPACETLTALSVWPSVGSVSWSSSVCNDEGDGQLGYGGNAVSLDLVAAPGASKPPAGMFVFSGCGYWGYNVCNTTILSASSGDVLSSPYAEVQKLTDGASTGPQSVLVFPGGAASIPAPAVGFVGFETNDNYPKTLLFRVAADGSTTADGWFDSNAQQSALSGGVPSQPYISCSGPKSQTLTARDINQRNRTSGMLTGKPVWSLQLPDQLFCSPAFWRRVSDRHLLLFNSNDGAFGSLYRYYMAIVDASSGKMISSGSALSASYVQIAAVRAPPGASSGMRRSTPTVILRNSEYQAVFGWDLSKPLFNVTRPAAVARAVNTTANFDWFVNPFSRDLFIVGFGNGVNATNQFIGIPYKMY